MLLFGANFLPFMNPSLIPVYLFNALGPWKQIGFLYPHSGAELLNQKRCSAQHCKDYATSLKICLYKVNALHLTVKKDGESKENPAIMKLKVIKPKSFRHSMHCKSSRVSFVSGVTNSCRF